MSDKEKSKNRLKGIKMVLRNLPIGLSESELKEQLGSLPAEPVYWRFSRPNPHLDYQSHPFVVLAISKEDDALDFAERFNGFIFVDAAGNSSTGIVELAACQELPRTSREQVGKDSEVGRASDSSRYHQFVAMLNEEVPRLTIDEQLKIVNERRSQATLGEITPLAKHVLQQYLEKTERIAERRVKRVRAADERRKEKLIKDAREMKDEARRLRRDEDDFDENVPDKPKKKADDGRLKGKKLLEFAKGGEKVAEKEDRKAKDREKEKAKRRERAALRKEEAAAAQKEKRLSVDELFKASDVEKTAARKDKPAKPSASVASEGAKDRERVRTFTSRPIAAAKLERGVKEERERKPKAEREIYRPGRLRKARDDASTPQIPPQEAAGDDW